MRPRLSSIKTFPFISPRCPVSNLEAKAKDNVMSAFKTIEGMDFSGKRVLLRADLNVPVQDGKVTDATRIERVVPTIREIIKAGGKAILISHFGRPKGKVDKAFSLEQVVPSIVEATGHPVGFIDTDWVNVQAAGEAIDDAPDGSILVLENTRFH